MDADRLTQLESWLRSGSLDQCKVALDELAQSPSELAVPLLQRVLTEREVLRRRFAVMGLGNHRTEQSFEILKALIEQEKDGNVLGEVANSLYEFGEVAVPLLHQIFDRTANWLTRQTILSILMEAEQDEVLLAVTRSGLADETQTVREAAILALGSLLDRSFHQEALDLLFELADSSDWRDRWKAATALCRSSDPKAKLLLAELQQDENHFVVAAALESGLSNG